MVSEKKCFTLIVGGIVACLMLVAIGCQPSTPEDQALRLAKNWAGERAKEDQEREYSRLKLSGYSTDKKSIELTLNTLDVDATAVTNNDIFLVIAKADCPVILTVMGIERKYDNCGTDYLIVDIGEDRVSIISSDQAQKLQKMSPQEKAASPAQPAPSIVTSPSVTTGPTAGPSPTATPVQLAPVIAAATVAPPTPRDIAASMGAQPTATSAPAPAPTVAPTPASTAPPPTAITAAAPTAVPTVPSAPTATAVPTAPTPTPAPAVAVGSSVGERVPEFTLSLADGSTVSATRLIQAERPTFLFFFASF